ARGVRGTAAVTAGELCTGDSVPKIFTLVVRRDGSCSSRQENVMRKTLMCSISVLMLLPAAGRAGSVETVVVTATRTPQPSPVTGESIDVITSQDLDSQQIAVATD